jgi:trimeric autotransporter adhesin
VTTHKYVNNFTLIVLLFFAGTSQMQAQSVGIGTTTPNTSSVLELSSPNKGLLIPRVALTSTTTAAPVTAFVAGMVLYNTATAGDVSPGYYVCDGAKWVRLEVSGNNWGLNGNAGTNPATNFIGTTDNADLVFKRNNVQAGLLNLSLSNTSFGLFALNPAGTGSNNTALGSLALSDNETGYSNTAIGVTALVQNNSGWGNIAIGTRSLFKNISGFGNVAVGNSSQFENETGGYNTSIGTESLRNNRADNNTALGGNTLLNNITGYSNVAVGINALISNTNRSNLVAVGDSALYSNGLGVTFGFQALNNTAIGSKSLFSNGIGYQNTATGYQALYSNQDGFRNTANGNEALFSNTSGNHNTAYGHRALNKNSSGNYNIGIGVEAGYYNTTGSNNTSIGSFALGNNIDGNENIAIGNNALVTNVSGYSNVAIGSKALYSNTNRNNLVAIGDSALYNNGNDASLPVHATRNTAIGSKALYTNTIGYENAAFGYNALHKNTVGKQNTAIGYSAGYQSIGNGNVFIGANAGENELGSNKLYIHNNNGDANNALIYGEFNNGKLQVNGNLGIGRLPSIFYPFEIRALGPNNEIMKLYNNANAEKWHLNLLSNGSLNFVETNVADNRLVLGVDGQIGVGKVPDFNNDSRFVIKQLGTRNGLGIEAAGSTNHWDYWVSSSSNLILYYNGVNKGTYSSIDGAYIMASDRRLKKDIVAYEPVLNKLNKLQAFNYHYLDNTNTDPLSSGFMAQDVQKLFPQAVTNIEMKNGETRLGINYQYFTVAAIKGLQEQQEMLLEQKTIIESQEQRIARLEELVKMLVEKK